MLKKFALPLALVLSTVALLSPLNPPWAANSVALTDVSATNAEFTPKLMVNDKLATSGDQLTASDKINLSVNMKIETADVGEKGSFYVAIEWNDKVWMMKDDNGNLLPWDGDFSNLVAYLTKEELPETEFMVEVISGLGGLTGHFSIYFGYQRAGGNLIYNAEPIEFTVQSIQQVMSNSLHGTTRGMGHFYSEEQGGFEQFTHIPYDDLSCSSCHTEKTACTNCHETPGDSPDNAKCLDSCHKRQKFEQQFSPDVHLMDKASGGAGLKCSGCHSAKQIHGDGTPYNSLHENPNKVDCQQSGCHTDLVIAGKKMHETHNEKLDCAACHVKTTMTCYSCHFEDGSVFQPPISDWKILVKKKSTGKVTTGNIQTMSAGGNTLLVVAPYYGHTVNKDSSTTTCNSCHDSEAVREYKENGTMTLGTWNDADKTITNLKGVVPIPSDWQTSLRLDFIAKNADGEWEFVKDTADVTQMLYAEPIDVSNMPKF